MATEQINLRLDSGLIARLEALAADESIDRATLVRRLLVEGVRRAVLERALAEYRAGRWSAGRVARETGLSIWAVLEQAGAEELRHVQVATVAERLAAFTRTPEPALADIAPQQGRVLVVGFRVAEDSVAAGHYLQGRLGRRVWQRLESAGLLRDPVPGAEDLALAAEGHGITVVVAAPGPVDEASADEVARGRTALAEKIGTWRPALVVFLLKRAAAAALGDPRVAPGSGPEIEGVPTFLLPNPYAPKAESDAAIAELRETAGRLAPPTWQDRRR